MYALPQTVTLFVYDSEDRDGAPRGYGWSVTAAELLWQIRDLVNPPDSDYLRDPDTFITWIGTVEADPTLDFNAQVESYLENEVWR